MLALVVLAWAAVAPSAPMQREAVTLIVVAILLVRLIALLRSLRLRL